MDWKFYQRGARCCVSGIGYVNLEKACPVLAYFGVVACKVDSEVGAASNQAGGVNAPVCGADSTNVKIAAGLVNKTTGIVERLIACSSVKPCFWEKASQVVVYCYVDLLAVTAQAGY